MSAEGSSVWRVGIFARRVLRANAATLAWTGVATLLLLAGSMLLDRADGLPWLTVLVVIGGFAAGTVAVERAWSGRRTQLGSAAGPT